MPHHFCQSYAFCENLCSENGVSKVAMVQGRWGYKVFYIFKSWIESRNVTRFC